MATSVAVFSQANMNAIDGSSVWAQSMALALAGVDNVEVAFLLSHAITTDRILGPLLKHPGITVIDPVAEGMSRAEVLSLDAAASILAGMAARGTQAFIVRGLAAAHHLALKRAFKGKLWPYLTDTPQRAVDVDRRAKKLLSTIMAASPVLLCQTEELRSFLSAYFPDAASKAKLFPPAIPGDISPVVLPPPTSDDLRLCYSGKFARVWNTYEMCDLPQQLGERGIAARLTMVGDKVNKDPAWPGYVKAMKKKLASSPGVEWVGGVSRGRSIELMSSSHIGLSWRSPELDGSLELSTKLLEYCAAGTPPILNRTPMHERIFGEDYPLFVDTTTPVLDVLELVAREPETYQRAIELVTHIPADYTLAKASERLAAVMSSVFPSGTSEAGRLRARFRR